jgi:excisionase family DNA binding protein
MEVEMLTTKQAAERAGVSERRIRQLIKDGTIDAVKVGRDHLIDPDSLSKVTFYGTPGRPRKAA